MPNPPPAPRRPPSGLPIFWQVMGLALVVLVLALSINILTVLKAPEPPPSGYSLDEVATALKTGQVRLQNGHSLKAQTLSSRPSFETRADPHDQSGRRQAMEAVLAARLASELQVAPEMITLRFAPRPDFYMRGTLRNNVPRVSADTNGPHTNAAHGPDPLNFDLNNERNRITYPPFNVALKLSNGTYRVITAPKALIEPWQERLLLGFGLTALLILPLAWLLSRQLARPIIA
ncbi:MAG: two-component sensor histidine kinase, partial [Asticcacaulis sp.]